MSSETAIAMAPSLTVKSEANSGRPSMFHSSKQFIEAGDLVILHQTRDNLLAITVTPGQFHHSKWGRYGHDDMIGMRFGSRMASPAPHAGFIHLLRPTPSLWSLSLPHRTQIVYLPDISFIMNELRIRPGSRIIEAGTGSGSMSHSLAMTVGGDMGPDVDVGVSVEVEPEKPVGKSNKGKGKLFTFEYHATRFEKAREEFSDHGLEKVVQLEHRNVCKDGFGQGPSKIDAVFLDLPAPWEAIPHAVHYLREDVSTRICSFSPCIEQVTKTVQALDAHGFTHIEMYEVLVRPHEVLQTPPTLISIETVSNRLKRQEIKREQRRQVQIDLARKRNAKLKGHQEPAQAQKGMDIEPGVVDAGEGKRARSEQPEEGREPKRRRTDDVDDATAGTDARRARFEDLRQEEEDEDVAAGVTSSWNIERTNWVTRVVPEVRGHTSYLTFATMFPRSVREAIEKRELEKKNRVLVRTAELAGIPTEGGLAKAVAMRAVAGQSSGMSAASSTAGSMGSLPGTSDRTIKREESFDTQASDGYERVFASMTEEDFAALP